KIVFAGQPNRSVLLYRMMKVGRGRMPHIGSSEVDEHGVELMRKWIKGLSADEMSSGLAKACAEEDEAMRMAMSGDEGAIGKLLGTTSGAMALMEGCRDGTLTGGVREKVIAMAAAQPTETARDLFEPMIPVEQRVKRLGGLINPAELLAVKGD